MSYVDQAARREMRISHSEYTPFDDQPPSSQKAALTAYYRAIQDDAMYLMAFPENGGGVGLILYSDADSTVDLSTLVTSFIGQICTSDKTLVPPPVRGRGMDHGYRITSLPAHRRAQVRTAEGVTDLAKQFEDKGSREEYRSLSEAGSGPLILGLLGLEYAQPTEWNVKTLRNVLEDRHRAGYVTIVTTSLDRAGVFAQFGPTITKLLETCFETTEGWDN